ncbi:hypothetical protein [Streptomyces sp. NPDC008092]
MADGKAVEGVQACKPASGRFNGVPGGPEELADVADPAVDGLRCDAEEE